MSVAQPPAEAGESAVVAPPLAPRLAWANLSSVTAAHAVIHATVVLMPLVYPILQRDYGYSYTQIGLLVGIASFAGGLLQLVFGYLGRYVARKTMLGVGNLVVGASMFLTGTSTTFATLMAWTVLGRVGGAPQHPVGSALLTDSFAKRRRGFALAAHVAGGNLGTLAVPLTGVALIARFGWQPTVMLFALPGLVAGTAVLLFAREPASYRPPARATAVGESRVGAFLAPLRNRGVLLIILASILASGGRGVGVLTTYLPLYLTNGLKLPAPTVAWLFTLLLAGSVVGPLVAGRLSDVAGRRLMLLVSYGSAALVTSALPLAGSGTASSLWQMIVVLALLGLTAYAESPLLQAYLADHAPEHLKDAAFGWYFTLAFGIGSLWATVLGTLIDRAGFAVTFWVMAASYVLAGVVVLLVPALPRGATSE